MTAKRARVVCNDCSFNYESPDVSRVEGLRDTHRSTTGHTLETAIDVVSTQEIADQHRQEPAISDPLERHAIALLREAGWTLGELAMTFQCSENTISRIESEAVADD